jgi:hypothetical protein
MYGEREGDCNNYAENIRCHHTKFRFLYDQAPKICAPLAELTAASFHIFFAWVLIIVPFVAV